MVITVTLNPALDKTIHMSSFEVGKVNRCNEERFDIGGKGINVSKVLKNFGVDSIATGFLGGVTARYFFDEFEKMGIDHRFIQIDSTTRTNMVITTPEHTTNINAPGAVVTDKQMEDFIQQYEKMCQKDDIVVISGSAPSNVRKDIYAQLITIAKDKGCFTIFDADGEVFTEGLKAKPHMIKPNDHELSLLFQCEIKTTEQIIEKAKALNKQGIENVLVSLGGEGSVLVTEDETVLGKPCKVEVKSTVGAGDSMVAAFIYGKLEKMTLKDTIAFANATGAATVMLPGTEACSLDQVNGLLDEARSKICLQ